MTKPTHTFLSSKFFRHETVSAFKTVNFILSHGGIGDYIGYLTALKYIADNHPQVVGRLFVSDFFMEIPLKIFEKYPQWTIFSKSSFTEEDQKKYPTYLPFFRPINGTGGHPVDLGFIYYMNLTTPPEKDVFYPQLNLNDPELWPSRMPIPASGYAVMTPGAESAVRMLPAQTFNAIKEHIIKNNLTPVFLGKEQITDKRIVTINEGYDFSNGINLINETSLLEAAYILSKAKFVIGLDNGLLHLAATSDVPIIFGYNIASPEHRRPRRPEPNRIYEIYPDEKDLPCIFCQSRMRLMFNHDFKNCIYKDSKCLDELSDPAPWLSLIDLCLKENP